VHFGCSSGALRVRRQKFGCSSGALGVRSQKVRVQFGCASGATPKVRVQFGCTSGAVRVRCRKFGCSSGAVRVHCRCGVWGAGGHRCGERMVMDTAQTLHERPFRRPQAPTCDAASTSAPPATSSARRLPRPPWHQDWLPADEECRGARELVCGGCRVMRHGNWRWVVGGG
jgi:hypothetical protein